MKVLFSALHHAYFRNFESAIRELAARGHHVHLAADELEAPEDLGGRALVERLAAEYPTVTWDLLPSFEAEPWFETARKMRLGLDYVRALEPPYLDAQKLRIRARERAPRLVRWTAGLPGVGPALTRRALTRIERLLPRSARLEDYVRRHAPDVVLLASLTYSRSKQLDLLKASRTLGLPIGAAIMSWDHLSSKALVHLAPDMVLVWNDVQRREAVEMHGLPLERIAVTGAQCYDQWFTRVPARDRRTFCEAMGLRPDRPFALWVHSALSPTPNPPEPVLVTRWLEALRSSADPQLRELGVLVRPHPERLKEWAGIDLSRYENVAFRGRNPIDPDAKHDYFDALSHCSAVIGLVTSAFLEAAIVGRPVLTMTLPEYRSHQEEMVHFRYLTEVGGGLLQVAPDLDTHLRQLAEAIRARNAVQAFRETGAETRDAANTRFLTAFVRPQGLDVPATPAFVDAVERLHGRGSAPDPTLDEYRWLRPIVAVAAGAAQTKAGRWLMRDPREDVWEEQRSWKRSVIDAKVAAKARWQRAKQQRRTQRDRRDRWMRRGKEVKSLLLKARYHVAMAGHRALARAGLKR